MSIATLEIKARIIRKLVQWRRWHDNSENVLKGLPSHLREENITKIALIELEKYQWIIPVKKTNEIHYSLNPKKIEEILKFYERYCKESCIKN